MVSKINSTPFKVPLEVIQPDEGSSFRILHHKVEADSFQWNCHYHPEIELVYVNEGTGRRHVGNHVSYYQDGDLILLGSNLPHSGFGYGSQGLHEEVVVQFSESLFTDSGKTLKEYSAILSLFEKAKFGICFYGETKKKMGSLMLSLSTLSAFSRFVLILEILGKLAVSQEFVVLNESNCSFNQADRDHNRLRNVLSHLEKNYKHNINMNKVAEAANLSVPAFCNYFKKMTGKTYTDFVNDFRVNKACNLLLLNKSILDICFETGFANHSYFSRVFKKVKGKTPTEFKNDILTKKSTFD